MNIFKSKSGFTLIELLVVIGILAVLAAIVIPSVAGLIDRANVSADKTNANEMTNAIERFAAEYELYCQDVASGVITASTTDFDAAQGRVHNVTGITDRAGITKFESDKGYQGRGINRDTKYPANEATLKAIVENYTKTSSTTFAPKQSDMEFYYSPEAGLVIVGETGATIDVLNDIAFASEEDMAQFDTITWICLDEAVDNIATSTEGVSDTLNTQIVITEVKQLQIKWYLGEEIFATINYESDMTWREWMASEYYDASLGLTIQTGFDGKEYIIYSAKCANETHNHDYSSNGFGRLTLFLSADSWFYDSTRNGDWHYIQGIEADRPIVSPYAIPDYFAPSETLDYIMTCFDYFEEKCYMFG
jgi:prepilin-type N-terminal cleavage/methylation domain-containing protein